MYKCMRAYASSCMHTFTRVCVCMHAWVYKHFISIHKRVHSCMLVCMCMHMYTLCNPPSIEVGLAWFPPLNIKKLPTPMLIQFKRIAECSKSILQHFWPSLSFHLSLMPLFRLDLGGRLIQVLLYKQKLFYKHDPYQYTNLSIIISAIVFIAKILFKV